MKLYKYIKYIRHEFYYKNAFEIIFIIKICLKWFLLKIILEIDFTIKCIKMILTIKYIKNKFYNKNTLKIIFTIKVHLKLYLL